jgi:hypothetical protein
LLACRPAEKSRKGLKRQQVVLMMASLSGFAFGFQLIVVEGFLMLSQVRKNIGYPLANKPYCSISISHIFLGTINKIQDIDTSCTQKV